MSSNHKVRFAWLRSGLFIATCLSLTATARAQVSTEPYAGLSMAEARTQFQTECARLRGEQRSALRKARAELAKLAQTGLNPETVERVVQLAQDLKDVNDLAVALQAILQVRSQLNARAREPFDRIAASLTEQLVAYQQCKLSFQPVVGHSLAKRWTKLTLEEKRVELSDYLALADQRPMWLLRNSPINISELVPKSALTAINQYLAEKQELIQAAQADLKSDIEATILSAREVANSVDDLQGDQGALQERDHQREMARGIVRALESNFGRSLRGVLLCQPQDNMSAPLKSSIETLLRATSGKLREIDPAHQRLLAQLDTRIESGRNDRLQQLKFEEQMVVDLYVAHSTPLIEPVRVLVRRTQRSSFFEDARLSEFEFVDDRILYRVETLIDGDTHWVECSQLATQPVSRNDAGYKVPSHGPGLVVKEETDLRSGQVFAHGLTGWRPVVVVDESLLGVALRWHGAAEPIEFYAPRHQLRIEAAQ